MSVLLRPFEEPRLLFLICDNDPATAGASPVEVVASTNPGRAICQSVGGPVGRDWLRAIDDIARQSTARDTVIVLMRGEWTDSPEPALRDSLAAIGRHTGVTLEIRDVIVRMEQIPAKTVILCLDDADPNLDQFSEQLHRLWARNAADRVVVVTAHQLGEESFPLPGRRCTSFARSIAASLGSGADRDRDQIVTLQEFLNSLEQQVDGWAAVLTNGRESQTPVVFRSPASLASPGARVCPVLQHDAAPELENHDAESGAVEALRARLASVWQLAGAITSRAIQHDVPLVLCRGLHRDVCELERRWRLGETSDQLVAELTLLQDAFSALDSGQPVAPDAPQWARDLAAALPKPPEPPAPQPEADNPIARLEALLNDGAEKSVLTDWLAAQGGRLPLRTRSLTGKLLEADHLSDDHRRRLLVTRLKLDQFRVRAQPVSWAFPELSAAERTALRAERLVLDQVERNWRLGAEQAHQAAEAALGRARSLEDLHRTASGLYRRTIWNLPDLLDADMRLQFWENDPSEVGEILDETLVSLVSLRDILGCDNIDDPGVVQHLIQALQEDQDRLLQPVRRIAVQAGALSDRPSAMELMRLLRTTLLSTEERVRLLSIWPQVAAGLPREPLRPTAAGRIIVRGLADGLAANCLRRVRFEQLFGDPSQWATAAEAVAHVDAEGSFLNSLLEFHRLEGQWLLQQPSALRQQCTELVTAPLTADRAERCRALWTALDGLHHESHLPPDWPRLASRLRHSQRIRQLDHRIRQIEWARSDAAEWERDCYDREEAELRAARASTPEWPPPASAPVPVLHAPAMVSLTGDSNTEVRLEFDRPSGEDNPVHVTVQYDESGFAITTADGRPLLSDSSEPWPYLSAPAHLAASISTVSGESRELTLRVRQISSEARPSPLLVRLHGPNWTARALCRLMPPRILPVELVLNDEFASAIADGSGFVVEPLPNRTGRLQWALRNSTAEVRQAGVAVYAAEAPLPDLPEQAIASDAAEDLLRKWSPLTLVAEVPSMTVPPEPSPVPVPFPKQDAGQSPVPMSGGLIVVMTDPQSRLTRLHTVRFHPQRPVRFVAPAVDYDRTTGRITIEVKAANAEFLPLEGVPLVARLAAVAGADTPVRTAARLTPRSPNAVLTMVADPANSHRVELDVADWPRAFCYDIVDGQPELSERCTIRIVAPPSGTVYRSVRSIPLRVELDTAPTGFVTEGDWFEVGVDANHDRRLDREDVVRVDRDRHVVVRWRGADADGTTTFDVLVGDFDLTVPADGIRNQPADILARLVRKDQTDVWGNAVPVIFDETPPFLTGIELQPGPTVVIGEPVVVLSVADDGGFSGVSTVEVSFDPSRSGQFDDKTPPIAAVPLNDGRWRAAAPTDKLEQGRHLLLARAVDRAGNVTEPHLMWIEAITADEAARRQAARTVAVTGQVLYGTQPASGTTVTLTADQAAASGSSEPMNTEKSAPPARSYTARTGEDGRFVIPAVPGGAYSLHIDGRLRGQRFERQSELTIDVDHPPPAISVRLDRQDSPSDGAP